MKQFLRNLLIGEKHIPSFMEYKFAMLRGEYALILLVACVFYISLDLFNGVRDFIPYYSVFLLVGLLIIHLNRIEYYRWSTAILIGSSNVIVFLFADADHPAGGIYFFYASCAVVSLVLVGYYNRVAGWVASVLPILLGYVSYLFDLSTMPRPSLDAALVRINFLSNFTIGSLITIVSVQFLIRRNRKAERSLLESERHLLKTSNELRKSEERFELALKGTRAGIYEWDIATNHVYVSEYWKTLLGYAPNDQVQVTLEDFLARVHPDDVARTTKSVEAVFSQRSLYQNEVRLRTNGGEYKWFLDSGIIKTDEKGNPQLAVGSIIDIQERKTVEDKIIHQNELLAKANKELDYFVYSVSHDLRAPLSSILGLTNIYKLTQDDKEKEAIVKMISDRAFALDDFIREVLDYSRNSRVEVRYQRLGVRKTVDEVLEGLKHMHGFNQVSIQNQVNDELHVVTDHERLKVMLSNLIANAVNYRDSAKQPFIRLTAVPGNQQWSFSVTDNGIGIKPEHQGKIFEMFYKAHDRGQGTGLGLYIVQEAIQKLGGTVTLQSEYGKGSTFTITLPIGGEVKNGQLIDHVPINLNHETRNLSV